jgi:hypothetical protein
MGLFEDFKVAAQSAANEKRTYISEKEMTGIWNGLNDEERKRLEENGFMLCVDSKADEFRNKVRPYIPARVIYGHVTFAEGAREMTFDESEIFAFIYKVSSISIGENKNVTGDGAVEFLFIYLPSPAKRRNKRV